MGFFSKLFGKKSASEIFTEADLAEANVCPNCWGKQAYDGKYVDYVKDQTKSNTNKDAQHKKAFIQQFVETNVTGIHLKIEGNEAMCPACSMKVKVNAR